VKVNVGKEIDLTAALIQEAQGSNGNELA